MMTLKARRAQRGFTLLETLIAMVIISFGVMVLANSWSGNVVRLQKSRLNSTIASLLQRKMTETEVKYHDKPLDVPEEEAGDFGSDYPGYTWTLKSKEFEMPDLSGAMVAKEGGVDEMTLMIARSVADYIKQSVKEVTVTVIYKNRLGRQLKNSVTTYFIDYTKDVPLGNGAIPGAAAGGAGAGGAATGGGAAGGGTGR